VTVLHIFTLRIFLWKEEKRYSARVHGMFEIATVNNDKDVNWAIV